jgi:hypothetical protein
MEAERNVREDTHVRKMNQAVILKYDVIKYNKITI